MATPLRPIARRALAAQSDDRLVRLLRDGHEPAFEEVVRRYRGPLVAFATAIAGSGRAEDVVQSGLMRAHAALLADRREINLRPWLFAIVRNGALNAARDEPAWSELDPELHEIGAGATSPEQREELEHLVNAICALPESQRQALVMREMEGVGHAEIAAKLHTSPTAVRGLIFRARTTLRNALGALVPLPLLRWLLSDPATAAAATAGAAGAGGGGAVLGGAFGKAAVGITAAVVAVGAGSAIDRRSGEERQEDGPEAARAATGSGGSHGGSTGSRGSGSGAPGPGSPDEAGEERDGDDREGSSGDGDEPREDRREDRGDEGSDHEGAQGGGSGSGSSGGSGSGGSHSGSGGGSSGSSSGGGGHGHSGSGDSDDGDDADDEIDDDRVEPEEPDEPEEPEVDEDRSGSDSGSSGSGSGPGSGSGDDD